MGSTSHPCHIGQDRRWASVVMAALLSLASGCMCQRGLELRGDWALQLNHVPWDCAEPGCVDEVAPHAHAAPMAPAPVHRFHPVPVAPAMAPRPIAVSQATPEAEAPTTATPPEDEASPRLSLPRSASPPGRLPENDEAVSVLTLKPAATSETSSWVFRPQAASHGVSSTASRRRPGDGWHAPSSRR